MLYIIGGLIILLFICAKLDMSFLGCLFFIIIAFILWRIGILGFILRIVFKVIRWIFIRIVYYYDKFFGNNDVTALIHILN